MRDNVPLRAYILAILTAVILFPVLVGLVLVFHLKGSYPLVLAVMLCGVVSAVYAYVWPSFSWRWGVLVTSGCSLFLLIVFVTFLVNGLFEWRPIVEMIILTGIACISAMFGRWVVVKLHIALPGIRGMKHNQ
jgi:type II secretory pathway component PulF